MNNWSLQRHHRRCVTLASDTPTHKHAIGGMTSPFPIFDTLIVSRPPGGGVCVRDAPGGIALLHLDPLNQLRLDRGSDSSAKMRSTMNVCLRPLRLFVSQDRTDYRVWWLLDNATQAKVRFVDAVCTYAIPPFPRWRAAPMHRDVHEVALAAAAAEWSCGPSASSASRVDADDANYIDADRQRPSPFVPRSSTLDQAFLEALALPRRAIRPARPPPLRSSTPPRTEAPRRAAPSVAPTPSVASESERGLGPLQLMLSLHDGAAGRAEPKPKPKAALFVELEDGVHECVVCFDPLRSVVFQPCAHLVTCERCGLNPEIQTCPICRGVIADRVVVSW
jgi:hypothetical protein